jgi:hypothetical protein
LYFLIYALYLKHAKTHKIFDFGGYMKKLLSLIFLGMVPVLSLGAMGRASTSAAAAFLGDRPKHVQTVIDSIFEKIKTTPMKEWAFRGDTACGYFLLGLNDDKLLKSLIHRDKSNIYIIDVGSGNCGWGNYVKSVLLRDEKCRNSWKHFHIFNITGGLECEETVETEENVTLYKFKQFKIEDIKEEFLKRGFDLEKKVDLIVSCMTLKHLIDPFGAIKRLYSLLTPSNGILMSNGFYFKFDDSDEVQSFPDKNWNILASCNAIPLFSTGMGCGHFLLMRNNDHELNIPLTYTGDVIELSGNVVYAGQLVTVVSRKFVNNAEYLKLHGSDPVYYCDNRNQESKDLFSYLKNFIY